MILNALILGFIFSLLGYGVFVAMRILNFTDLTAEASFTLGAAITVMMTKAGLPFLGVLLGMLGGALAGAITGLLHTKLKIDKVLSGILTLTAFYTINLIVTGFAPNLSLARSAQTVFIIDNDVINLLIAGGIAVAVGVGLLVFFRTRPGLALRACGDNETMVQSSGKSTDLLKVLGLMLANGLVGLSGSLFMEFQRYYDSTFGTGMMIVGVSCIVIGEIFTFRHHEMPLMIIGIILGSILYRFIYLLVLNVSSQPQYMKLFSSLSIIVFIVLSKLGTFEAIKRRRRAKAV